MLNFNAYKYKDLQHFIQMLNQCEIEGVTDIRYIREKLHKHLYRPQKIRPVRDNPQVKEYKCPECEAYMSMAAGENGRPLSIEGNFVLVCPKCRYSEVHK